MSHTNALYKAFLNYDGSYNLDKAKAHPNFLSPMLQFISSIPVKKNESGKYSFPSLVEGIVATKAAGKVKSSLSEEYLDWPLLAAYFSLIAKESRSKYLNVSQTKAPELSAAVPLVLKAYKDNKGIKYEDWDWTNLASAPVMETILGHSLTVILPYIHMDFSHFDLPDLRRQAAISSKGGALDTKIHFIGKTDNEEFEMFPKLVKQMLLQFWIFHPTHRSSSGSMILSLENLDSVPNSLIAESIEEVVPW